MPARKHTLKNQCGPGTGLVAQVCFVVGLVWQVVLFVQAFLAGLEIWEWANVLQKGVLSAEQARDLEHESGVSSAEQARDPDADGVFHYMKK